MNKLARKLNLAKSMERVVKVDVERKLKDLLHVRNRVFSGFESVESQRNELYQILGYVHSLQESKRNISPEIFEAQSKYISGLYGELEKIELQLRADEERLSKCRDDLKKVHNESRLATKNKEKMEKRMNSEKLKREMQDISIDTRISEGQFL